MINTENKFAWSVSRYKTFQRCRRKYYFHYYGYWNGWSPTAPPRVRTIYMLKKLISRQSWVGQHVHQSIQSALEALRAGREPPSHEYLSQDMLKIMREEFKSSRAWKYREDPKTIVGLFEHEYDVPVTDAQWKELADRAAQCLRAFYELPIFSRLKALSPEDYLVIETLLSLNVHNVPIQVKLDLAYRDGDSAIVCDWETGESESEQEHRLQAACYALAVTLKWPYSAENVKTCMVYLPSGRIEEHAATAELMEETRNFIHESADEMLFPLTDPEHNLAEDEEAFDMTDDPRICKVCNFMKVCPRWQEGAEGNDL